MPDKQDILKLLGRFPEKVEPHLEVVAKEETPSFSRCLVEYNVEREERIRAYLLIPPGGQAKRLPAMVAVHQHAGQYYVGKSEPAGLSRNAMYHYGLELCLRGYIVLCPDMLAFEDRRPPEFMRRERWYLEDRNYEFFCHSRYMARGQCLQTKNLHDVSVAVDVLQGLEFADRDRIGIIGHSMGGEQAYFSAWYDERLRVGVSSCGVSTLEAIFARAYIHNYAFYIPGLLQYGDMELLARQICPRPFMMVAGDQDWGFPVEGVRAVYERALPRYQASGQADRLQTLIFSGEHSFPAEARQQAYEFVDRFLKE